MIHDRSNTRIPAPCIIDTGIVVNKRDMFQILKDLGRVRYLHWQDGQLHAEGEGYIMEVFADPERSTLIANHTIYLNVYSFDCLEMRKSRASESYLDLIQDERKVRLIPLSNPLQEQPPRSKFDAAEIEAVVAEVLSAKLDADIDLDDGMMPF